MLYYKQKCFLESIIFIKHYETGTHKVDKY